MKLGGLLIARTEAMVGRLLPLIRNSRLRESDALLSFFLSFQSNSRLSYNFALRYFVFTLHFFLRYLTNLSNSSSSFSTTIMGAYFSNVRMENANR
jgi:hypothetical protein